MKATRISGDAGGPGVFAVSDGVKAWDAIASEFEGHVIIDVERSDVFAMPESWEIIGVKTAAFECLLKESLAEYLGGFSCADHRRKTISG